MDLYVSQGFDGTTAADIAASVGLTERTFFRHFADKREVIFGGHERLEEAFVQGVATAPADASPLAMVASALAAVPEFFSDERRSFSRQRQVVIAQNGALQERELLKMRGIAASVAAALRSRDVDESTADLAAESGVTVFGVTFKQWIAEGEERSFADIGQEVLAQFVALTAAGRG
jgi:AcrR family transcriptional regulator